MAHPVVVVDVQEQLFNAVDAERRDDMVTNVKILVSSARRLGVPVLVTEQYPKGLGRTLPEVRSLLGEAPPFEKTAFSCAEADGFMERLRALGTERQPANLEIGLGQARQAGAVVTATETVVFQLLGSADSDAFREFSKLLR